MSFRSTSEKYGSVAVTLHWLSAIVIVVLIGSGFRAAGMEDATAKAALLRLHLPLGLAVLVLTLTRIAWWLFVDRKPTPPPMPRWQDRSARAIHILFYVILLGMAASGIGMVVLSGAGPLIFDGAGQALPNFSDYPPRIPHGLGARLLVALLIVHIGAALHHHFIKRDSALRRMWYGAG